MVAINNVGRPLEWNSKDPEKSKQTQTFKNDLYDNLRAQGEMGVIILLDDDNVIASLRSVQYEYVQTESQQTTLRIWGEYTHIVEGIIRAAWANQYKDVELFIEYC